MKVCRCCHCPVVMIAPGEWACMRAYWYPDIRCADSPSGHHEILMVIDVQRDIARWLS